MRKHNTASVEVMSILWYNSAMKIKLCKDCNKEYSPIGHAQKYCLPCGKIRKYERDKKRQIRYREKKGKKVGVGSGNNQGLGKTHATYKNGTGIYKKLGKEKAIELGICERCKNKLELTNPFKWCTHHKDHNRKNNEIENLEILCKSCHQKEHKVHINFNKGIV
jgi:Zn finger protein HypA/HybF involved in hydrogenase expression